MLNHIPPLAYITIGFALDSVCWFVVGRMSVPTIERDKKGRFVKK